MNTILHKSDSRGLTATEWLVSRHTFSFNDYFDPERIQFGALRVLNDDLIMPGAGFPPHSHRDMEIITIPIFGTVAHEDSTGGRGSTSNGEVQIMSAGTGVTHSEYNASKDERLELFQIWVLPERLGLKPRYEQKQFELGARKNNWQLLVSPDEEAGSLKIFQNAWFSIADLDAAASLPYRLRSKANGAYVFVVSGSAQVSHIELGKRDGLGITDVDAFSVEAKQGATVLVMEVPV